MSAASNSTITTGSSDPPPTSSTPSSSISSIVSSDTPSSTPPPTTSSTPTPSSSSSLPPATSLVTTSVPPSQSQVTQVVTVTSVETPTSRSSSSQTTTSSSATTTAANIPSTNDRTSGSGGLSPAGRTAIAVVVPVVAVALLVLAGLFLWRRRKQRKNAEEARRKEVEDYGYNPNNDPTLPAVGGVASSEMMEDSSGYRGWGNMTNASNRKTSTTVSAGHTAVSDSGSNPGGYRSPGSPTQGASDGGHSVDPLLMGVNRRATGDADGIGALGAAPTAGANRGDIRRGPSNASSSYSAGNHSESSDGQIPAGSPQELYSENAYYQPGPYGDGAYGGPQQPVIRDVQARRNTRIENPSFNPHQGNSGIAQNF